MATAKNAPAPGSPAPPADCPETQKVFDDFQLQVNGKVPEVTGEKAEAKQVIAAKKAVFDGALKAACIERKSFQKVQDAQKMYTNILNCQAIGTCKDIEQVQAAVKAQTDLAADVKKSFDTVLGDMKALKAKLDDVHIKTDAFRTLVKNSCNTEDKKKATGIDIDLLSEANLTAWVNMSVSAQDGIDQACETAVQVAGIFAFTNVGSLKSYADAAKGQCDAFKTDVETNLKNGEGALKGGQKSLTESLNNLSVAEADWRQADTVDAALDDTATDTCFPIDTKKLMSDGDLYSIEEIKTKVKEVLAKGQ